MDLLGGSALLIDRLFGRPIDLEFDSSRKKNKQERRMEGSGSALCKLPCRRADLLYCSFLVLQTSHSGLKSNTLLTAAATAAAAAAAIAAGGAAAAPVAFLGSLLCAL